MSVHLYKVVRDLSFLIGPGGVLVEIVLERGDIIELSITEAAQLPTLETLLAARVTTGPSYGRTFVPHVMDLGSKFAPLSPLECLALAADDS